MKKNSEISKMFAYAGSRHWLTILGMILAGLSTMLSMIPFVCIWFVVRDLLNALAAGDMSLAAHSGTYAWWAASFSVLSILLYFLALCCSHLAAFRTASNMRKAALHHIVTLPLGYFSQNASGRLRKIIDDNAGLTEEFLAHQLPDLTGAVVMPIAVLVLIFSFDWRLGLCCLVPLAISFFCMKQMMGGDNAHFMEGYMTALETMNKMLADAGVEFVDECPEGFAACRTFSDYRPDLAALDAYVADNAGAGLLAEETSFGVTLLAPVAEGADEAAQAAAQRKADFQAAYEDGAKARREWLAAHAGDLKSMRRTALALTAFAMEAEAVESFEELLGRPIDRTPTELAVAMGWRAAWNMSGWTAWSLMEGGSSVYFNRATVENVTIIYETMKADGYEPNAAETETYETCMARLGSEE